MKKGDIVQHKKHKEQIAVCTTNEMQSGYLGILQLDNGEDVRLLTRANRWQVVEFADGRINRALFPERQEPAHEFEAQYYQEPFGIAAEIQIEREQARRRQAFRDLVHRAAAPPAQENIQWYGDPIDRWNEV